jgi:hypothetical protein
MCLRNYLRFINSNLNAHYIDQNNSAGISRQNKELSEIYSYLVLLLNGICYD